MVRLVSLARGMSGVRFVLLERLALMLSKGLTPIIPSEGSVGASGDLTPLSYLAAALIGEGNVWFGGREMEAAEAWAAVGVTPLKLHPKEGLAIMNGTAAMTAIACLAWERAEWLGRFAARLTSMTSAAIVGNHAHFDARLSSAKPHPGQAQVAAWMLDDLEGSGSVGAGPRVQDRYSVRCAPHVIGVLLDALSWFQAPLEVEVASADDNPLVDPDTGDVLHGGNFYGGHVAFMMDSLKAAVASVADLLDRQVALMTHPATSGGLPANLSGATGDRAALNHGLKALGIATSAWAAEALKCTMPAASFSRSTESHNQDKVPMGTIAARDCMRVLELTEQVAAGCAIAGAQGVALRRRMGGEVSGTLGAFADTILAEVGFLSEDRPLDTALHGLIDRIHNQDFVLPGVDGRRE